MKIEYSETIVRCSGSVECGRESCRHYGKHRAARRYDGETFEIEHFRYSFRADCKKVFYCERVKGFVRCIDLVEFKRMVSSDPNYSYRLISKPLRFGP